MDNRNSKVSKPNFQAEEESEFEDPIFQMK